MTATIDGFIYSSQDSISCKDPLCLQRSTVFFGRTHLVLRTSCDPRLVFMGEYMRAVSQVKGILPDIYAPTENKQQKYDN